MSKRRAAAPAAHAAAAEHRSDSEPESEASDEFQLGSFVSSESDHSGHESGDPSDMDCESESELGIMARGARVRRRLRRERRQMLRKMRNIQNKVMRATRGKVGGPQVGRFKTKELEKVYRFAVE